MKKMMLLASMVAFAVMMLAAAPAFAQPFVVCHKEAGVPDQTLTVGSENAFNMHIAHGDTAGPCEDDGNGDGDGDGNGDGNGNGDDNDNDNDNDRDVFIIRGLDNQADLVPDFDLTQDIEQECDSGDVSQPVDVSQTGNNSIQTVGVQPTANTGCAQNALGVLDAGPFVGDFAGDNVFVNNDGDDNDGRFFRCDRDGDGNDDDDCDDFDNGRVFCDRDGDGNDDGDDDCFVFVHDNDNDNDNDNVIIRDRGDRFNVGDVGNELEIEDVNANIDLSPTQNITGGGTIDQTAIAIGGLKTVPSWLLT